MQRVAFERTLIGFMPQLRGFARFLTRDPDIGDDLVQESLLRALKSYRTFAVGSNFKAWMFMIMRNVHINGFRKQQPDQLNDLMIEKLHTPPAQGHNLELQYVLAAIDKLSPSHREVISLVRAGGASYEEASLILGCKLGTLKSRMNRADAALRRIVGKDFMAERPPPHLRLGSGPRVDQLPGL
jgi:RNA polymerase sigma-70 factor (ECF subfamily)